MKWINVIIILEGSEWQSFKRAVNTNLVRLSRMPVCFWGFKICLVLIYLHLFFIYFKGSKRTFVNKFCQTVKCKGWGNISIGFCKSRSTLYAVHIIFWRIFFNSQFQIIYLFNLNTIFWYGSLRKLVNSVTFQRCCVRDIVLSGERKIIFN